MKEQKAFGIDKKPKAMILTSFLSESNSSNMVFDMAKSLSIVYDIDVLTKYPNKNTEVNVISVYSSNKKTVSELHSILKYKAFEFKNKLFNRDKISISKDYHFYGLNERNSHIPVSKILNKISDTYDFFIIFFWQGMIDSSVLRAIFNKTGKPQLFFAADMFPMTGGCSYFWDCQMLANHCGKCPGLHSSNENDITRKNFLYKKEMLDGIKTVFMGNSWQVRYAKESKLFKKYSPLYPIVDENIFRPDNKRILQEKAGFQNKRILFFGALGIHDSRKGFMYLVEALKILAQKHPELVPNIILMVAGSGEEIAELEQYNIHYTGHISFNKLPHYYALADIFLSPSIQDAGPMMLNQSLMCGTPAVAFEIGTACDILNNKTGYKANYKDSEDFYRGIIDLLSKPEAEFLRMQIDCRLESLNRSSFAAFRQNIELAISL